jgi:hypothetical protein
MGAFSRDGSEDAIGACGHRSKSQKSNKEKG